MLVTARNAIYDALTQAGLPLSPTLEKVWKTPRLVVRGQGGAELPETAPLVSVLPVTVWAYRASKATYGYGAAIAIAIRAHAPTEARCDELSDFVEDVIAAAEDARTDPEITEILVAKWVDFDLLHTSHIWSSEIHCLIGLAQKGAS